jgi:glycosyltransferase involved in cell wall biosynthesis
MSTPSLSIIMASHNDADQTALTLASIRETSPPSVEIVVVDDCSATPLVHYVRPDERTKLVTNRHRCGCGPSRHIGAMKATGDWLLIMDSHMRLVPGWYEEWTKVNHFVPLDEVFKTVFCCTCCGLDSKNMDPLHPVAEYSGATWNVFGPDRLKKNETQVWECVWLPREPALDDGAELSGIMGAAYIVSREWFLHLSPTRYLRSWGCDEQQISAKSWLAGGSVRLAKSVKIGHKFLRGKEVQNFGIQPGVVLRNKLFSINTLCPPDLASQLSGLLLTASPIRESEPGLRLFRDDYYLVGEELAYNQSIFTKDFRWLADKFQIPLP